MPAARNLLIAATVGAAIGAQLASRERRRLRERLRVVEHQLAAARYDAVHDPLTGVANRAGLDAELATRRGEYVAVLLDIDGFKAINDTCGHDTGDAALCAVADRLAAAMEPSGFAARLGGDEFFALLPRTSAAELPLCLARLHSCLAEPAVTVAGEILSVGVSIGACMVTRSTPLRLVKARADHAMYRAKRDRSGFAIYDPRRDGPVNQIAFRPGRRRREYAGAANASTVRPRRAPVAEAMSR